MRGVEYKDSIITQAESSDFNLDEKVLGVNLFNQGTNTMMTSIGSGATIRATLPGQSVEYFTPNTFIKGTLKIEFTGAGESVAIMTTAYDRGEICD